MQHFIKKLSFLVLGISIFSLSSCADFSGTYLSANSDNLTNRYDGNSSSMMSPQGTVVRPAYQPSSNGWSMNGAEKEAETKAVAQDQPFAVIRPTR
jgi:hypothetical protein